MSKNSKASANMDWTHQAELALKEAVAKTIEEHARDGDPIVVWEDGRVVRKYVRRANVAEREAPYGR